MTTIKTQFVTLHNLIKENEGKKLTPKLIAKFEALMESKVMAKTFKKDDEGNVTHIFCYYHKEWEEVANVPYGKKASTSHGFNTMCKQGVSNWTKQQRVMKAEKAQLLDDVANEVVPSSDLAQTLKEIEERAKTITPYEVVQTHDEQVAELEESELDSLV